MQQAIINEACLDRFGYRQWTMRGKVRNHPKLNNGSIVYTSPIVGYSKEDDGTVFIYTMNTEYRVNTFGKDFSSKIYEELPTFGDKYWIYNNEDNTITSKVIFTHEQMIDVMFNFNNSFRSVEEALEAFPEATIIE